MSQFQTGMCLPQGYAGEDDDGDKYIFWSFGLVNVLQVEIMFSRVGDVWKVIFFLKKGDGGGGGRDDEKSSI